MCWPILLSARDLIAVSNSNYGKHLAVNELKTLILIELATNNLIIINQVFASNYFAYSESKRKFGAERKRSICAFADAASTSQGRYFVRD